MESGSCNAPSAARLLDQFELELEDLGASATEEELAAEKAAAKTTAVAELDETMVRACRVGSR